MNHRLVLVLPLLFVALLGCAREREVDSLSAVDEASPGVRQSELVGRVLLPGDGGRRGLELHAWATNASKDEARQLWILPEADGRFARPFSGTLTKVSVLAGSYVHEFDAVSLPEADSEGRVDLGEIDLRSRLVARSVRVIAGADEPEPGVVRVALSVGPSHRGPLGELPSLGSRQFPTVDVGSRQEWLLPPDAEDLYFLVERPDGIVDDSAWRSGEKQVFGPFDAAAFPLELRLGE